MKKRLDPLTRKQFAKWKQKYGWMFGWSMNVYMDDLAAVLEKFSGKRKSDTAGKQVTFIRYVTHV